MSKEHKAVRDLATETQAATALRESILRLPDVDATSDADVIHDVLEGETNLAELVERVMALMTDTEVMLVGLDDRIKLMESRKHRYTERKNFLRAMIEQAMVIGEIKKLELPDATLSLSHRVGGVVIVDEMRIPSDFWRRPDPEVDKAKVSAVLKDGGEVPGATLGNGTISLTVRRQ